MILSEEDKLYQMANDTCHKSENENMKKVRDQCHETGNYRGTACNIGSLKYNQQNFVPVIFHNGSGYDFSLLYSELFKQNNDKGKLINMPLAGGKSKMFSIVRPKIIDRYKLLAMSRMARLNGKDLQTLYLFEDFGLDTCNEVLGYLNIEDFKSSLPKKLPTQEKVGLFNNKNGN